MNDNFREAVARAIEDLGFDVETAGALGALVDELSTMRMHRTLAAAIEPLRQTVFGQALWQELSGDTSETEEAAAARLHTSTRQLRAQRQRIRDLLRNPVPPAAKVSPDENI